MSRLSYYQMKRTKKGSADQKDKTYYRQITDLGMTFGSIAEDFRIWLTNDIKHFCDVKYTYVSTENTGTRDFYFTEGMLMTNLKPNLSLQYTVDHSTMPEYYRHPSLRNMEAMNIMKSKDFMESVIFADEDGKTIDVRTSYKIIQIIVQTGIVTQSRYHADNITNAWTTRRQDGVIYASNFLIDFEIPDYIIEALYVKFNISRDGHRPMLRWLNAHTRMPVYYGLNTYNAKPKFFLKYKVRPLIRPEGITNPQAFYEANTRDSEMWTITRSFALDVAIPNIIGITGYVHRDRPYEGNVESMEDLFSSLGNEYLQEFSLQIEDKHAVMEYDIEIDKDDVVVLSSGKEITKKIDIKPAIREDLQTKMFIEWAKKLGLDESDLFDFTVTKVMEGTTYARLGKGHTLSEALDKLGMTVEKFKEFTAKNKVIFEDTNGDYLTIDDMDIPIDRFEYDNYIKNTKEMWFVDLTPDKTNYYYRVTIYLSMRLYNQFVMETGYSRRDFINSDDMHDEYAQGKDLKLNDIQDRY